MGSARKNTSTDEHHSIATTDVGSRTSNNSTSIQPATSRNDKDSSITSSVGSICEKFGPTDQDYGISFYVAKRGTTTR